tara:strand:+ start:1818 stop:3506 length:1689 start_codon:yes stop_codon:yes gene_type:complete
MAFDNINLFGFEIKRKKKEEEPVPQESFTPPVTDDGAAVVTAGNAYGTYVDFDNTTKLDEGKLITKYRQIAQQPEAETAVDEIINEAIVGNEKEIVEIQLDDVEQKDKIKKRIKEEFDEILTLLDFDNHGYDIFRRWYIDGRLYYHIMIDEEKTDEGIKELRNIDPRKIKKVKEIEKKKDPATGAILHILKNEYYIYNEFGINRGPAIGQSGVIQGVKIAKDSITLNTSGIMDETNKHVLSYLHKAIKPANQLRMLEDSTVIYRLARAPERRIFYIDVGNLPKIKAEQYLTQIMTRYKNKLIYDATTGDIQEERRFMTMLEDYWLPRREGGRGTEISTLPGGENLGQIEDVQYFLKKVYKSLSVPLSRMESEAQFQIGRASEISRDEVKFSKFIQRLRKRFSHLFDDLLKKQLILKKVLTEPEWDEIKEDIIYNFIEDNLFTELKESEIMRERLTLLADVDQYVGKYYSVEWIRKNVLRQTDDDIKEIDKEIEAEEAAAEDDDEEEAPGPSGAEPKSMLMKMTPAEPEGGEEQGTPPPNLVKKPKDNEQKKLEKREKKADEK